MPSCTPQAHVPALGLHGYQSALVEAYAPMEIEPETPGVEYRWQVAGQRCGPLGMTHIEATGNIRARITRMPSEPAARKFILSFVERGTFEFCQGARHAVCGTHSLVLMNAGQPLCAGQQDEVDMLSLVFPGDFLRARIPHIDDYCTRPLPVTAGAAAVLRDLMRSSWREAAQLDGDDARLLPGMFAPLINAVFRNETAREAGIGMCEVLHARMLEVIDAELQNPVLSPRLVAERLGISTSYLYTIARAHGSSVRNEIINRRLDACRDALADSAWARRSVTEIAFAWGFQEASHFSRRFSQRFGVSPRVFRDGVR